MNIISSILLGYGLGIIILYLIFNSFFSYYHALDSNNIKKEIITIGKYNFILEPYFVDNKN